MSYILSLSANLIPVSAGVKRQAGQEGSTAHLFLSVSRTLSDSSQDSAVSFMQWSELDCQIFLTK
jgi:hypothetical protein